jgi:hypothetical protein
MDTFETYQYGTYNHVGLQRGPFVGWLGSYYCGKIPQMAGDPPTWLHKIEHKHATCNTPLFVTLFKLSLVMQKWGPIKTCCAKSDLLESIACLPWCCVNYVCKSVVWRISLWSNSIFVFLWSGHLLCYKPFSQNKVSWHLLYFQNVLWSKNRSYQNYYL